MHRSAHDDLEKLVFARLGIHSRIVSPRKTHREAQRVGDLDGAISAYREAIRLDPTFSGSFYNLGVVLKRRGDAAEAQAAFARYKALQDEQQKTALTSERDILNQGQPSQRKVTWREHNGSST